MHIFWREEVITTAMCRRPGHRRKCIHRKKDARPLLKTFSTEFYVESRTDITGSLLAENKVVPVAERANNVFIIIDRQPTVQGVVAEE
jgi:hypothetical protein